MSINSLSIDQKFAEASQRLSAYVQLLAFSHAHDLCAMAQDALTRCGITGDDTDPHACAINDRLLDYELMADHMAERWDAITPVHCDRWRISGTHHEVRRLLGFRFGLWYGGLEIAPFNQDSVIRWSAPAGTRVEAAQLSVELERAFVGEIARTSRYEPVEHKAVAHAI